MPIKSSLGYSGSTDSDFSKAVWLEIFIPLKIDRILFKPVKSSFYWKSVVPLIAEWVVAPPNVL